MSWSRPDNGDLVLDVFVQPRASRNRVVGPYGDRLKIAVTAAPVDGGANREVIRLVAGLFRVAKSCVRIEKGLSSRRKQLRIQGVTALPTSLTNTTAC